jgi:hypothetical protein
LIKWNVLVTANDGRKFYQNVHVIEASPEAAKAWVLENYSNKHIRPSVEVTEIEKMEDADLYLPGIVYESGRAYFE